MSMEIVTDYFVVDVPSDCAEDQDERNRIAFLEAENMAPDWIMPCEWEIFRDSGEEVVVLRRYRKQRRE